MRHTEAGLAIADFPLMGGQLIPPFDRAMLGQIARDRLTLGLRPVVAAQVVVHALLVLVTVALANYVAQRTPRARWEVRRVFAWINWLLLVQLLLGADTILTRKVPLVASLHVAVGACILGGCVVALFWSLPVRLVAVTPRGDAARSASPPPTATPA